MLPIKEKFYSGGKNHVLITLVKLVCCSIHALDMKLHFLINSGQIKSEVIEFTSFTFS